MEPYDGEFAQVYDALWSGFARSTAPVIYDYYRSLYPANGQEALLDLCCGSGHLACYFAARGFLVTGIDNSPTMLALARENAAVQGQAEAIRLIQGDAVDFTLERPVHLAVSTYNSLNHLDDEEALCRCFGCVYQAVVDGGLFVFDMKTRLGLMNWNNTYIHDSRQGTVIMKGLYDGLSRRASTRITTFLREDDDRYRRIDDLLTNAVFEMAAVKAALETSGWTQVHMARPGHLATAIQNPESETRVFFVARKRG